MADLPTAIADNEEQSPDITFQLIHSPLSEPADSDWIYHWYTPSGDISISLAQTDKGFLLRFPSLADFAISEDGNNIDAWQVPETDAETLRHLLLDQVMPRVLAHRGSLVLHASALNMEGRAIAFVGDTGQGKSTLAASLHLAGYPLLTDDGLLVQVEEACLKALPCYPGLRLWPQSVTALFKELPPCEAKASYSEKNRVILTSDNEIAPLELAVLFVLEELDSSNGEDTVKVVPLSQREACMALICNSFKLDVTNHNQAKKLFAAASAVAKQLPVFSLSYPRDFSCLPAVHEVILQQCSEA